jgi:hypothetical protein
MKVQIFYPDHSRGLELDSRVLHAALQGAGHEVVRSAIPREIYGLDAERSAGFIKLDAVGDVAVFIERVFEHPALGSFKCRAFVPNLEWLTEEDVRLAERSIDVFWHKSKFSEIRLRSAFPRAAHRYLGFTSFDFGRRALSYQVACHLRGKSLYRNSQELIDLWTKHPEWPKLRLQAYQPEAGFLCLRDWFSRKNIDVYFGFLPLDQYIHEASFAGIHLCTSETEGFGHYINEARALGAVAVVLDAPPMNELVDASSGWLVPVVNSVPIGGGARFQTTRDLLEVALIKLFAMTAQQLAELGSNARIRYESERQAFLSRMPDVLESSLSR